MLYSYLHRQYKEFIRRRLHYAYPLLCMRRIAHYIPWEWLQEMLEFLAIKGGVWVRTFNRPVALSMGRNLPGFSVYIYDNFVSPEDCDRIIEIASKKGLVESTIVKENGVPAVDTDIRMSKQTWLEDHQHPAVKRLSQKTAELTGFPMSHQEFLQVVEYSPDGYYRPHFDASFDTTIVPYTHKGCGPRIYTLLVFLNDDFEGGETEFPFLSVKVEPKKGRAILFRNTCPNNIVIPESFHGGRDVRNGSKWIANKWVRPLPFELWSKCYHKEAI